MAAPVITTQPVAQTAKFGYLATFSVVATGATSYAWFNGANAIGSPSGNQYGEHTATLSIPCTQYTVNGSFYCKVTNTDGTTTSSSATLTLDTSGSTDTGPLTSYGPGTGGASTSPGIPPTSPDIALDGDWSNALPSGAPLVSFPFLGEGDNQTKIVRQPVQGDVRYRGALPAGTIYGYDTPDNNFFNIAHGNTYSFDEGEPRDMGGWLGEWIRSYASIPATRTVPESFVYSFQYYSVSNGGSNGTIDLTYSLVDMSRKVSSRLVYEYFHVNDAANYPPLLKPQIFAYDSGKSLYKIGDGTLYASAAGKWFITSDGTNFIAEDSDVKIWHFPIMVRVTRYIDGPTDTFWGSALSLPSSA